MYNRHSWHHKNSQCHHQQQHHHHHHRSFFIVHHSSFIVRHSPFIMQFQVQVHPACLWAARIGRTNLEGIGENFLQSARCSSLGPAGRKNSEIFRQVCPQFHVGCQSVPIIRLPMPGVRLKF